MSYGHINYILTNITKKNPPYISLIILTNKSINLSTLLLSINKKIYCEIYFCCYNQYITNLTTNILTNKTTNKKLINQKIKQ